MGGVKLNYPLVPRSPGTFAGALALSVLHVRAVPATVDEFHLCTPLYVHPHTAERYTESTFMEAFSIKINTEGCFDRSPQPCPLRRTSRRPPFLFLAYLRKIRSARLLRLLPPFVLSFSPPRSASRPAFFYFAVLLSARRALMKNSQSQRNLRCALS